MGGILMLAVLLTLVKATGTGHDLPDGRRIAIRVGLFCPSAHHNDGSFADH
jgi:hypothetical protein